MFEDATPKKRALIGLFGVEGSGKTFMATEAAILIRKEFGLDGPICWYDTENASGFRARRVKEATGQPLKVVHGRDLDELRKALKAAMELGASVVVIDSFSHILDSERERYFAKAGISDPTPDNYRNADANFKQLVTRMLGASINLVITGREGQVYGTYKNSRGKTVQGPVGVKMRAGHSGYDFDLLLRMERNELKGGGMERKCLAIKDRSDVLHGTLGTWTDTKPDPEKVASVLLPWVRYLVNPE